MKEFDLSLDRWKHACLTASDVKAFAGAAYRSRLNSAFAFVKEAYDEACAADDKERGK